MTKWADPMIAQFGPLGIDDDRAGGVHNQQALSHHTPMPLGLTSITD
jgi:hypothetical protein